MIKKLQWLLFQLVRQLKRWIPNCPSHIQKLFSEGNTTPFIHIKLDKNNQYLYKHKQRRIHNKNLSKIDLGTLESTPSILSALYFVFIFACFSTDAYYFTSLRISESFFSFVCCSDQIYRNLNERDIISIWQEASP